MSHVNKILQNMIIVLNILQSCVEILTILLIRRHAMLFTDRTQHS
jgi:hypothetical protein